MANKNPSKPKAAKIPNLRISIGVSKGGKYKFSRKENLPSIQALLAEAKVALSRKEVAEVILIKPLG